MKTLKQIFWTLLWSIPIILIIGLVFLSYVRRIEISMVTIKGDVLLTAKEIKSYVGISIPMPYLNANTSKISEKLEAHPLIYKARVKKKFDGTLTVSYTHLTLPTTSRV